MSEPELKELADDIKQNGLQTPIIISSRGGKPVVIDGRNRLDALAILGRLVLLRPPQRHVAPAGTELFPFDDPDGATFYFNWSLDDEAAYAVALSFNLHRRHLTGEQKRDLIAKRLKAQPETSDRAIGTSVRVDNKTVAAVRSEMVERKEIPHVEARTDTKGRKQPSKPKRKTSAEGIASAIQDQVDDVIGKLPSSWDAAEKAPEQAGEHRQAVAEPTTLQPSDDTEANAEKRKAEYAKLYPNEAVASGCDFDPENDSVDGDTTETSRRRGAIWQADESLRMATEFKMLESSDSEIDDEILLAARKAAQAWADLVNNLAQRLEEKHSSK